MRWIVEGREIVAEEEQEVDIVVRVHFEASAMTEAFAMTEASATVVAVAVVVTVERCEANTATMVDNLVLARMSSLYFLRNC